MFNSQSLQNNNSMDVYIAINEINNEPVEDEQENKERKDSESNMKSVSMTVSEMFGSTFDDLQNHLSLTDILYIKDNIKSDKELLTSIRASYSLIGSSSIRHFSVSTSLDLDSPNRCIRLMLRSLCVAMFALPVLGITGLVVEFGVVPDVDYRVVLLSVISLFIGVVGSVGFFNLTTPSIKGYRYLKNLLFQHSNKFSSSNQYILLKDLILQEPCPSDFCCSNKPLYRNEVLEITGRLEQRISYVEYLFRKINEDSANLKKFNELINNHKKTNDFKNLYNNAMFYYLYNEFLKLPMSITDIISDYIATDIDDA